MAMTGKLERKFLAHYIDESFNGTQTNYVRLGQDLEAYSEELNPQVEVRRNILGEQNVTHSGYQVQSTAEPFYAYENDPLFNQLAMIANTRGTGDACQTTRVEVLVNAEGTQIWAYREDCWVVPNSVGGDTTGVQIPFTVYNSGNRVPGMFDPTSKEFTAFEIELDKTSDTVAVSATTTLAATTTPSGQTVVWSSSDESIATVSNGTVTGVAPGSCNIIADLSGVKAVCKIEVTST